MSHDRPAPAACIILAAGSSSRMGTHKFALPFDGERLFIHKIAGEYVSAGCSPVVVVVSPSGDRYGRRTGCFNSLPMLVGINEHPGRGRLLSIITGIMMAGKSGFVFVQNIDQPFISGHLLKRMMKKEREDAYVAPVSGDRAGHPVLLGRKIMDDLLAAREEDISLRDFLSAYEMIPVKGCGEEIFVNINTPEDYLRYFNRIPPFAPLPAASSPQRTDGTVPPLKEE
jgi:CTP:molybdopterin cytidylyltransferase MocA